MHDSPLVGFKDTQDRGDKEVVSASPLVLCYEFLKGVRQACGEIWRWFEYGSCLCVPLWCSWLSKSTDSPSSGEMRQSGYERSWCVFLWYSVLMAFERK